MREWVFPIIQSRDPGTNKVKTGAIFDLSFLTLPLKMVTKRCSWGTCKSDSRYKHKPHMKDVFFKPFPKPKTALERCKLWIQRCGRPHQDLSVDIIKEHHFVCSKVFFLIIYFYLLTCICIYLQWDR